MNSDIFSAGSSPEEVSTMNSDIFSAGSSPLGLKLKKSPSFLELLQKELSESDKSSSQTHQPSNAKPSNLEIEKLKAANFQATLIQIGTWQRSCQCAGDLIGKCYYSKRKLVWEVLDNGLKNKMEIQWSDISALKAEFPEGRPGVLHIELSRPPLFFHEITPQARKHTLWHSTSDFTDGQASIYRLHTIQFPRGIFERHYENLLRCDERLMALSKVQTQIANSLFVDVDSTYNTQIHHTPHYLSNLASHTAPPFVPSTPNNIIQNTSFPYNNFAAFHYNADRQSFIFSEPNNTPQNVSFPAYHHNLANAQVYRAPNPIPSSASFDEMLRNETLKYGIGGRALNMQQVLPNHSIGTSPELVNKISTNISNGKFSGHEVIQSSIAFDPITEMKLGLDECSSTITNVDEFDNGDEAFMCPNLEPSVRDDMFLAHELLNSTNMNEEQALERQCQMPSVPTIFDNDFSLLGQGQPINKPMPTIFNMPHAEPSFKNFQTDQLLNTNEDLPHAPETRDEDGFLGWTWD